MDRVLHIVVPVTTGKASLTIAELRVGAGDRVWADDVLATVETEKTAIDIVAPADGVITEVRLAAGDTVLCGTVLAVLAASAEQRPRAAPRRRDRPVVPHGFSLYGAFAAASGAAATSDELHCELLVLGAGPGGYSAAFRGADLGLDTLLVERHHTLGGVCLNVGCIPSKALLHLAAGLDESARLAGAGIRFGRPEIDLGGVRAHKDAVVRKLTGGLAGMARARRLRVVHGVGRFVDAHHLQVELAQADGSAAAGARQPIHFDRCIIAAGSRPVHLPFLPKDERIVDSTGALELRFVPQRMLVIGGGIIGLEMATVYSALGARIDVAEMEDFLMPGPDRDLVAIWHEQNRHRFDRLMLGTRAVEVEARSDGVWVRFEGGSAPSQPLRYDMILQAAGRRPNGLAIGAERAGVAVDAAGFIAVDGRLATNVGHIFAVGDITGQPMLAHKAIHQAHVAAEAAAGLASRHDGTLIPGVAYTNPELAWVGLTEDEAERTGAAVEVARFPWAASGRAIANGAECGMTKLVFDRASSRLVGGAIVGANAGELIGEVTLAISRSCDAESLGRAIHHPHPTLAETVGLAAVVAHGSCTDLPAVARRSSV